MIQHAAELTCLCNMNMLTEVMNNICQTLYMGINQGCTKPRCPVAKVTNFVQQCCEASVCNLLHVTLTAPRLGVSGQNKTKKINQYTETDSNDNFGPYFNC
jgi:hypothetical protein